MNVFSTAEDNITFETTLKSNNRKKNNKIEPEPKLHKHITNLQASFLSHLSGCN